MTRLSENPWFRIWMPYVFMKLDQPGHVYLPVNRNYKPLGMGKQAQVDYEQYGCRAMTFAANPHSFADIWFLNIPDKGCAYLYADDPATQRTYFERLERLMSHKLRTVE